MFLTYNPCYVCFNRTPSSLFLLFFCSRLFGVLYRSAGPTWAMRGVELRPGSYKSQGQTHGSAVEKMACSCWNVGVLTSNCTSPSAAQPTNVLGGHTHTRAHTRSCSYLKQMRNTNPESCVHRWFSSLRACSKTWLSWFTRHQSRWKQILWLKMRLADAPSGCFVKTRWSRFELMVLWGKMGANWRSYALIYCRVTDNILLPLR